MQPPFRLTEHALERMNKRNIPSTWMARALLEPDRVAEDAQGNTHYIKAIRDRHGNPLHVVVDQRQSPPCIVTLFWEWDEEKGR